MPAPLKPCHKCGSPAVVELVEKPEGSESWKITCSREECICKPVFYREGNKKSRAAAVRTWNSRRPLKGVRP